MKTRNMKTHKTEFMQLAIAAIAAVAVHFAPAAGLREDFRSPQGAARENTGPLFWMHGDESEARLREMVGRVAESGQGALTIESRPHIDWMREGWWRDVSTFVDDIRLAPPTAGVLPQSAAKAANAVSGNWSSAALWADGGGE